MNFGLLRDDDDDIEDDNSNNLVLIWRPSEIKLNILALN